MKVLNQPWLEIAILLCVLGALVISQIRRPERASFWALGFTGAIFAATFLEWLRHYLRVRHTWSLQALVFGRVWLDLRVDELSAPLVPEVALLHFLTVVATTRTKMRRFSFAWSLAAESLRLATFSCKDPWMLIALLSLATVPPYLELLNRHRPTRVYVLHMLLFVGLLVFGYSFVTSDRNATAWATVPLLAAILVRCGTVPVHTWLTDWFEHASFGNALLFVAPLSGVYAAVRLVLPIAPPWVLQSLGFVSLLTAVYASCMALVQRDMRRFFAFLFLSHSSIVLVGLELVGSEGGGAICLTGALCLWFSITLSLGGFGLTLRALEARFGRLSLTEFHGLYDSSPMLAVCFLLTGLASVGFPGTLGFVSTDLLVDGAIEVNLYVGLGVVTAAALNGIAVVRAYFLLFTGTRHRSSISLALTWRERLAVLTLSALILGGGLVPQPGVASRFAAARAIVESRQRDGLVETPSH